MARQRGQVRRQAIGFGVSAALVVATLGAFNAVAGATPSFTDFVVYGENGVHVGYESIVTGNVGSRHDRTELPSPHASLSMAGGSKIYGNAHAGENVEMSNNTDISGTLTYVGTLAKQASSNIGTTNQVPTIADAGLPSGSIPSQWPDAATYCATVTDNAADGHSPDTVVGNGQTINLSPGTYGTIQAGSSTHLNFTAPGDYYLDRLQTGNVTISYPAGVRLFVCSKVQLATIVNDMPAHSIYTEVAAIPEATDHHGFEVANGPWHGDIVVPTAGIHYGTGSSERGAIIGYLWAEHIDLEHSIDIVGPTTTTTTSTTSDSTTTTIIDVGSTTTSTTLPVTSTTLPVTSTTLPVTSTTLPATSTTLPVTSTTTGGSTVSIPTTTTTVPIPTTTTTLPTTTTTEPVTTTTVIDHNSTTTLPTTSTTLPVTSTTTGGSTVSIPTTSTTIAGTTTTQIGGVTTSTLPRSTTTTGGSLPRTGSDSTGIALLALGCIAAGGLLAMQRRRTAHAD